MIPSRTFAAGRQRRVRRIGGVAQLGAFGLTSGDVRAHVTKARIGRAFGHHG